MSLVGTWGAMSYHIRGGYGGEGDLEMAFFGVEEDMFFPEIGVVVENCWHPIRSFFPLS